MQLRIVGLPRQHPALELLNIANHLWLHELKFQIGQEQIVCFYEQTCL